MSIATLKATGYGRLAYALVIEGWPHIFVTDPTLTLTADKGDRTVIAGLQYDGLRFSERALPKDGKYEGSAITFKFKPPYTTKTTSGRADLISASFARRGVPVAAFAAGDFLTDSDTTIALQGASTLSNDTYYYVGTETIKVGTFPTISRAQFGSYAQNHIAFYINSTNEITIYDYPTTMDGRRVTLYMYEMGDLSARFALADGLVVWRGIVAMPPKLENDGVTWSIYANHVSHAWRQSLVSHAVAVKIVGIYHHERAPIQVTLSYDGDSSTHWLAGFYREPQALLVDINAKIADAMTALSVPSSAVEWVQAQYDESTGQYTIVFRTGASPPESFIPYVGSVLIGATSSTTAYLSSTGDPVDLYPNTLDNDKTYASPLVLPVASYSVRGTSTVTIPSLESATTPSAGLLGPSTLVYTADADQPADDDPIHDFPPNRIYIDHDLSTIADDNYIYIGKEEVAFPSEATGSSRAERGGLFRVDTADEDANGNQYAEITPVRHNGGTSRHIGDFRGFLTGDSEIRVLVQYADPTAFEFSVVDFVDAVTDRRVWANDGITPFLTPDDFDTTQLQGALPAEIMHRSFQFVEPVAIEDVVAHDALLAGHMVYTTSTGKLGLRPLPVFTDVHVTSKTVTGTKIITPADGYGSWPGYNLHPQGIVSTIRIQQGYDPGEDDWDGRTYEARDQDLISRHKKRGVGKVEITPRSNPTFGDIEDVEIIQVIAGKLFGFMGREYAAVTVEVPFTAFDYLLGDVVTLTSPHVPNASDGTVGLTGKRAVVMKRSWELDPKVEKHGELELWILLDSPVGYAPSAVITAQADQGSNLWNITCSTANTTNVRLSTAGDGLTLQHFTDGDYVRVMQRNHASNQVTGRISGTPVASAGTCSVQFDGVWTPGGNTWILEFQVDNGTTAQSGQRSYCYIADNDKKLASGSHSRAFA